MHLVKVVMTCSRILVAYNVHSMNLSVGQGVGDRALVAFDTLRVTVECLVVPSFWLLEAWRHFPQLWSPNNTILWISTGQDVGFLEVKRGKKKKEKLVPRQPFIQVREDAI